MNREDMSSSMGVLQRSMNRAVEAELKSRNGDLLEQLFPPDISKEKGRFFSCTCMLIFPVIE